MHLGHHVNCRHHGGLAIRDAEIIAIVCQCLVGALRANSTMRLKTRHHSTDPSLYDNLVIHASTKLSIWYLTWERNVTDPSTIECLQEPAKIQKAINRAQPVEPHTVTTIEAHNSRLQDVHESCDTTSRLCSSRLPCVLPQRYDIMDHVLPLADSIISRIIDFSGLELFCDIG